MQNLIFTLNERKTFDEDLWKIFQAIKLVVYVISAEIFYRTNAELNNTERTCKFTQHCIFPFIFIPPSCIVHTFLFCNYSTH